MNLRESSVIFSASGRQFMGILHRSTIASRRGVIILAGRGRRGPHRWNVIQARELAEAGFSVLRFSVQGDEESEGIRSISNGYHTDADIAGAINELCRSVPEIEEVILWGLCAAASNALQYAPTDSRVTGLVLVNLFLKDERTEYASALTRFNNLRIDIKSGAFLKQMSFRRSMTSISRLSTIGRRALRAFHISISRRFDRGAMSPHLEPAVKAMNSYRGRALLIFGGRDLTTTVARLAFARPVWRHLLKSRPITVRELPEADHLFSRRSWSDLASVWTVDWLRNWQ